jgi:hypothetical protein
MATFFGPIALEVARRWLSSARKRSLKNSPPTATCDIFKNRLFAASARTFVAQLGIIVVSAFQPPVTCPGADMLIFNVFVKHATIDA